MIRPISRATRHLVFWSVLVIAVSLTGLRLVMSSVSSYKADLANHVSALLGVPVRIGRLHAKMRGFNPELVLGDIAVQAYDSHKSAVALREIRLGFDTLALLIHRDILSSAWVTLVGAKFSVYRKDDGSFAIVGLQAGGEKPDWLWQGRHFELLQSEVTWYEKPDKHHPLKLQAVDVAIINQDQQHRINVRANLPDNSGNTFTTSAVFTGSPFAANNIEGRAYFASKQLKLDSPFLKKWLNPEGISVKDGLADISVWGRLQQSQLTTAIGKVSVRNAQLTRPDKSIFFLTALQGSFSWELDTRQHLWQLDIPQFSFHTHNPKAVPQYSEGMTRLKGRHDGQWDLQEAALFIRQLDLRQVSDGLRFVAPAPEGLLRTFAESAPRGKLENLALFLNLKDRDAAINGDLKGISFAPIANIPGVDNVSGHIYGTSKHGEFVLSTQNARLISPTLFREPIIIKRLQGKLAWQQQEHAWQLSSKALKADLPGIQSVSRVQFQFGKHQPLPFLDLQTALTCDDVSQLKHYFPVGVMKPADTEWLDRAFVQGEIHNGKLVFVSHLGQPLAGHVRDFDVVGSQQDAPTAADDSAPADDAPAFVSREPLGGGFFEAILDVRHLQLNYAPGWPQITDIHGQLRFIQTRMVAAADEARSQQLRASKVVVINPAIGVSKQLSVQGLVDGEISHALAFLKNTPLRDRIGLVADAISTKGATQVSLDLQVPLAHGVEPKVEGKATLHQASLNILALDLPVSRINGLLKFNEHGIYSDTINAVALKHPVKINIISQGGQTTLKATGLAALTDLERQFSLPHTAFANGNLAYQLAFRLPLDDKPSDLLIESDLAGIELKLPGLLSKKRDGEQALKVVFGLGNKLTMPINIHYAGQMTAALQFDIAQQRIGSGHIVLGDGEAERQTQTGLKLDINRPQLDLQDAFNWVAGGVQQQDSGLAVREINLHTDKAFWGQTSLGKLDLALKPDGEQWQGHINSAFAVGDLYAPMKITPESTIRLEMSQLDLSIIKRLQGTGSTVSVNPDKPEHAPILPKSLPLLTMRSRQTLWQALDLGALTLETERVSEGIAVKTLNLAGVLQNLSVSGTWTSQNDRSRTKLRGRLEMPKAGALLALLDISHDLVGSGAAVDFSAHWDGSPQQFSLAGMQGEVDLDFTEGRILSIDPGFGRVLGVLAMEQWAKRLQLDFRDLYQQGLTFNSIKGHFTIADGKAVTRQLLVDAIPARITLSGATDFINKTLDQQASVIPKSADALPIAGTIVDVFTGLVARTLTGDEQEGFLVGSQYQLKGAWDTVQVIPQHKKDGVVPKLWSGLTDFSWLGVGKKP